jgi:elongation factor G
MPKYGTKEICNLAIVGHGDSGKTTLSEGFLFTAKVTTRLGSIDEKTSVLDYDDFEKDRGNSLNVSIASFDYAGRRFNLADCPGNPDFAGDAFAAIPSVETAVICVHAGSGLMVNTRRMWNVASEAGVARVIVINKMDHDNVDFGGLVERIQSVFGRECVPVFLPVGSGDSFSGVVNLLDSGAEIPSEFQDLADEAKEQIYEADEALLEKYLGDEEISADELVAAISPALREGTLVPILCAAPAKGVGTQEVLDFLGKFAPSPEGREFTVTKAGTDETIAMTCDVSGETIGQVFKVVSDPFVGKLTYVRTLSGSIKGDAPIFCERTGQSYRIGGLFSAIGKDTANLDACIAGDIAVLTKVDELQIGDTICTESNKVQTSPFQFPKPMVNLAIEPKSRKDEGRIAGALGKLADMDPLFSFRRDEETHELIISGATQLQLEVLLGRLAAKPYEVEVDFKQPRIAYRETINATAQADYRHKKQSGGSGQFGEVHIRVEPQERGAGFEFASEIVGGAISQQYIPSVEKGIRQIMSEGAIAGYPVVDVKVVIYDGKEHPVDSKDIAFQIAGRNAFKLAMEKAKPVLLEPVMDVEITVPGEYMGSINGDLNSRRGRIQGMDADGDLQVIKAQVPMAEMMTYSTELRSITGGEGSYTLEFSHYDIVPSNVTQGIIAASAKDKSDDDE